MISISPEAIAQKRGGVVGDVLNKLKFHLHFRLQNDDISCLGKLKSDEDDVDDIYIEG